MKKVFLALILVAFGVVFFGTQAQAAGTGNLVVHFQKWDGDYTTLGSHAWGNPDIAPRFHDGVDDFGAYFTFDNLAVGAEVNFIAVEWTGTNNAEPSQDWSKKRTDDMNLGTNVIVDGKTTHVYIFEGAAGTQFFMLDPDRHNVLAVYYDPAGTYEENLGLHHWGWTVAGPSWASPDTDVLKTAGKSPAGIEVKAVQLAAAETWAGFLIYAGGDDTKKTGDLKPDTGYFTEHGVGTVDILYIVNAGDGNASNENVYETPAEFVEEAFSFKLMPFNNEEKSGTYAVDPNTIIVKTSATIASPYPLADDKDAAQATIESWFTVREMTGEDTYGDPLAIERVDFAKSNATLNAFVIILEDELDNTKDYELFFDLGFPSETLDVAKDIDVTINVTAPANTPAEAVLSIAGSLNGWSPGTTGYEATKVGDTMVYSLTFTVSVTDPYTTFEYKWTRGSWPTEEFVASNRPLVIPNNVDEITFEDTIEAWADITPPAEKYAAPVRTANMNLAASIMVDMDKGSPELTFISPTGIVGKVPAERIIEVNWGQPFNQNLFPRYRVIDDRDGELTPFVFVPKGQYSVLDTRTEGDYTIMLRVVDRWGNVTEETFIFRVRKAS